MRSQGNDSFNDMRLEKFPFWLLHETKTKNPLLWRVILLQLFFIGTALLALPFDERTVRGVSPWLKPIKFDLSILIYTASMIWVIAELPQKRAQWVSKILAAIMVVVTTVVQLQAFRGAKTHFHALDPLNLNSASFVILGVAIACNTALLIYLSYIFLRTKNLMNSGAAQKATAYGLVAIVCGSMVGHYIYFLALGTSLSVRAPASPSFFGLDPYTRVGALRVAHGVGLHGLQFFLIIGALFRTGKIDGTKPRAQSLLNYALFFVLFAIAALVIWAMM